MRIGYENVYLYLALCPFTGQGYAAFLPKLNAYWFGWFIKKIDGCLSQKTLFVADGATAHQADLFADTQMTFSKLPPACPELNPVERVFKEVRRGLKHRVFDTLANAENRVKAILQDLFNTRKMIVDLSCFPYILNTTPKI